MTTLPDDRCVGGGKGYLLAVSSVMQTRNSCMQVQRRLRQNREAAQRSRQRKKAYMAALEAEVRCTN